MITEFFLSIPYFIISAIINIIPNGGGVPIEFISSVHNIWGYMQSFSFIVPLSTLLWCLGITLAFEAGVLLWQMFNWLLQRIHK